MSPITPLTRQSLILAPLFLVETYGQACHPAFFPLVWILRWTTFPIFPCGQIEPPINAQSTRQRIEMQSVISWCGLLTPRIQLCQVSLLLGRETILTWPQNLPSRKLSLGMISRNVSFTNTFICPAAGM